MEKQITMKLPEDTYKDLKKLSSKKENIPLGQLIRIAIDVKYQHPNFTNPKYK